MLPSSIRLYFLISLSIPRCFCSALYLSSALPCHSTQRGQVFPCIGCGLRNSEIRALTLDDVDFINGIINIDKQIGEVRNEKGVVEDAVTSTKTPGSVRKLYAPKFVLDCLNQYINSLPYLLRNKFFGHI